MKARFSGLGLCGLSCVCLSYLWACGTGAGVAIPVPALVAPLPEVVGTDASTDETGLATENDSTDIEELRERFFALLERIDDHEACHQAALLGLALMLRAEVDLRLELARVHYYLGDFHLRRHGSMEQMRQTFSAGATLAKDKLRDLAGVEFTACRARQDFEACLGHLSDAAIEPLYWYGLLLDGMASVEDLSARWLLAPRRHGIWAHLVEVAPGKHYAGPLLRRGLLATEAFGNTEADALRWFQKAAQSSPLGWWRPLLRAWHIDTRSRDRQGFTSRLQEVSAGIARHDAPDAEARLLAVQARWLLSQIDGLFGPAEPVAAPMLSQFDLEVSREQ